MKLIAHRGLWKDRATQNSLSAFESALKLGTGIETDLRSFQGELYLSHDPIRDPQKHTPLKQLLELAKKHPRCPLFLNVKEDGLLPLLSKYSHTLEKMLIVFFDMSVPELVQYAKHFPPSQLCTRVSEFELLPAAHELCDWIWVDGFTRELSEEQIKQLTQTFTKNWAFVSPELHGRDQKKFWNRLSKADWLPTDRTFLCTDFPDTFLAGEPK